jgi:hypothetical protein
MWRSKLLLIVAALLICMPARAWMLDSHCVASTVGSTVASLSCTLATVNSSDLIVVGAYAYPNALSASGFTDGLSDSYTADINDPGGNCEGFPTGHCWVAHTYTSTSGSSVTVTIHFAGGGDGYAVLHVSAWSGGSNTVDGSAHKEGSSATPGSTSSSISATAADLIFSFLASSGGPTVTAGTGYTILDIVTAFPTADEYLAPATSGNGYVPGWSLSTSENWWVGSVAYKPSGGGPPPCTPTLGLMGVGRCG